jgi:acyl carrier protein
MEERIGKVFKRVFRSQVVFNQNVVAADHPRWTSLKHVELVVGLESEFGVRFDGDDATRMITGDAILKALNLKISVQPSA